MPLRKGTLPAHLALAAALLLCACTRGPRPYPAPKAEIDGMMGVAKEVPPDALPPGPPDWFVQNLKGEPDTLNPITSSDASASVVDEWVYETFVQRDPETLEWKPQLASSWESSKDGLVYTFHIRKDVRWHDGQPFTADDAVYSFKRMRDPTVDAPHQRVYYIDVKKFEKLDDYTVRCTFGKPYFLAFEICGTLSIVPKHIYGNGEDFNKHSANRHPIGTGPMRFVQWKTGEFIELGANPDYYDPRRALHFSRIIFRLITEDNVALQVFKQSDLDTVDLNPEQWIRVQTSKRFLRIANKLLTDGRVFNYIGWNQSRPQFQDKRVRKALTLLMPRQEIAKRVYHDMARVVCSPIFYLTDYYDKDLVCETHDPEGAKRLLAAAGWKDTDGDGILDKGGQSFHFELLLVASNQVYEQIGTIFKEEAAKAGIEVTLRPLDWPAFLRQINAKNFDACALGWSMGLESDPYQIWHSSQADLPNSSNFIGFKNTEADRLIEAFRVSFDRQERIRLIRNFQKIIFDEQPYTFLFSPKGRSAINKRIVGIRVHPVGFDLREWFVPQGFTRYARTAQP